MRHTIYQAAGGQTAFVKLAHAWHARCLEDPIVSHAFSHGYHPQHVERLAAYWAEALGGPPDYSSSMGDESKVVRSLGHGRDVCLSQVSRRRPSRARHRAVVLEWTGRNALIG